MRRRYIVRLRHKGKVYEHTDDYCFYDGNPYEDATAFMWQEGNYGCDCNRAIFALGDYEHPCGESAFEMLALYDAETGEVLVEEDR